MLHGCQKKIYHVRNVGGRYFDEAYLVMRDDLSGEYRAPSKDLAAEADRIIRDASASIKRKRSRLSGGIRYAVAFALGAVSSSAVFGAIVMLFMRG